MELNGHDSEAKTAASSLQRRKSSATRKVTIRLPETLFQRLDAAVERPGVGKSMVVQAALDRFFDAETSQEDETRAGFDVINERFDRLEHDIRMIAETVALHARYHLTVMPPTPEAEQRDACVRGDQRFKVLAEQVDRRVREDRPLIAETLLRQADLGGSKPVNGEGAPKRPAPESEDIAKSELRSTAAAGEGGSSQNFH